MPTIHLSRQAARHLQLAAQGLLTPPRVKAKPETVLAAIRRMALLQIDTIHVVARSPYLVLYSRVGAYDPAWLDQLLAQGALFEYWAHEACFIPVEDYGLLRHRMLTPEGLGWKYAQFWLEQHGEAIAQLLDTVRQHGPVRAADFQRQQGKSDGWWDWKPEKRHLEVLFTLGKLMVKQRQRFQRVYDVSERVLPHWDDTRDLPSPEQAQWQIVRNSCRALGIVQASWIADYYRQKRAPYAQMLQQLADEGELIPVCVEGWQQEMFVHASLAPQLALAEHERLKASASAILSPFDPLVWDRKRASALFDFDYKIECYTPAAKRQYGYFVLPILHRGTLVGRLDAKAHRQQGVFEIKALYLESDIQPSARLLADLQSTLGKLAAWHGTPQVRFGQVPSAWAKALLVDSP